MDFQKEFLQLSVTFSLAGIPDVMLVMAFVFIAGRENEEIQIQFLYH